MSWLPSALSWYFYLLGIGCLFYPLTKRIFRLLPFDHAYAFSKIIGILAITYIAFFSSTYHLAVFSRPNLLFFLAGGGILNFFLVRKSLSRQKLTAYSSLFQLIIIEEVLFLAAFLAWTYVRGQEPAIHGLEKFMDYGFINSILRSRYFPPIDMWLSSTTAAGLPINYYYFGHLTGALLIKLTAVLPAAGYNLLLA
ncbi:hypothetical protein HY214_00025, partial [Candidatus Roizmanbacteria bacterium]|nr:hypothetical protein [Candidatus Roizmanbacteria bacterium]